MQTDLRFALVHTTLSFAPSRKSVLTQLSLWDGVAFKYPTSLSTHLVHETSIIAGSVKYIVLPNKRFTVSESNSHVGRQDTLMGSDTSMQTIQKTGTPTKKNINPDQDLLGEHNAINP